MFGEQKDKGHTHFQTRLKFSRYEHENSVCAVTELEQNV